MVRDRNEAVPLKSAMPEVVRDIKESYGYELAPLRPTARQVSLAEVAVLWPYEVRNERKSLDGTGPAPADFAELARLVPWDGGRKSG